MEYVQELTKVDSTVRGEVLSFVMEIKYPQLLDQDDNEWISLDLLLDWELWPNYLVIVNKGLVNQLSKLYAKFQKCLSQFIENSLLKKGLSQICQIACNQAASNLKDVCVKVQCGDITMTDLDKLAKRKELMQRLCKTLPGDKGLIEYSTIIKQGVEGLHFFIRRRKAYQTIIDWIPNPSKVKGN